ncbi:MAG: hypothetical protein KIT84_08225 [Labilithrix sp.]|nr:hypothetical protein [Labilithrix sp.]MCW5810983.1 hypothetical protein [Labilithrix sp.]
MTRRADGQFDVLCADGSRAVVTAEQIAANQVCGGPVTPPPPASIRGRIFGRTDSCDGDPVATVRDDTDCFALSASAVAWSVWKDGRCVNISDTNVRSACLALKPEGKAVFGRSDSCEGDAVQVTSETNCFALSGSAVAWSVWKDGRCVNISDTNQRTACLQLKPEGLAVFGRSDSCEGDATPITPETDCFSLSASEVAWSVWKDGRCVNISDTNKRAACLSLQPSGRVIFGRSDSCEGEPVARITPGFDCFTLSSSAPAWSVWKDGRCVNISDTNVRAACLQLEPQ